jgi:hypothetical protein
VAEALEATLKDRLYINKGRKFRPLFICLNQAFQDERIGRIFCLEL